MSTTSSEGRAAERGGSQESH